MLENISPEVLVQDGYVERCRTHLLSWKHWVYSLLIWNNFLFKKPKGWLSDDYWANKKKTIWSMWKRQGHSLTINPIPNAVSTMRRELKTGASSWEAKDSNSASGILTFKTQTWEMDLPNISLWKPKGLTSWGPQGSSDVRNHTKILISLNSLTQGCSSEATDRAQT